MERRFLQHSGASTRVEKRADGSPMIVGYASVFYDGTENTEYRLWAGAKERIMPGAFDRALKDKDDARGLFNHDINHLLGRVSAGTMRLSVDKTGLMYEIDPPDTASARDVVALIQRGDLQGSSFSFTVTDEEWKRSDDEDVREIMGVRLFDAGPVTFPAYEGTTTGIRSLDDANDAKASHLKWFRQSASDPITVRARLAELGI